MGCGASAQKYIAKPEALAAAVSEAVPEALTPAVDAVVEAFGGVEGAGDDVEDEVAEDEEDVELEELETINLDLEMTLTRQEWIATLVELGIPKAEASDMYQEVVEERGENPEDGLPLHELLHELQVDDEDQESRKEIAAAIDTAVAKLAEASIEEVPEEPVVEVDPVTLDPAVDKIVYTLDLAQRPASDAWVVVQENRVPLSKAQRAAIDTFTGREDELVQAVEACMQRPPLISSMGGSNACRERCVAEVTRIIEECKAAGTKYTDPDWDMLSAPEPVLYVDREKPGYDCTVRKPDGYKRLKEIVDTPTLFTGGARPGDIDQGSIGTCYLLGAMGALVSQSPSSIQKMFLKYDMEVGVYGIRFCLDGEWKYVIIDDIMPTTSWGALLYAKSNAGDVWCPLLEKAFCKLHTCYEMCDGGRSYEACYNLCGGISGFLNVKDEHKAEPGSFFNLMKAHRQRGEMLTTNFRPKEKATGDSGKCGEATFDSGLVGGHCYSVLRVVEAGGNQLVCIRNPWGSGEWKGKWSDKNSEGEWTEAMKQECNYTGENDGKFWMSIQDFVENAGTVSYMRQFGPKWRKVSHYKHFHKGATIATAKKAWTPKEDNELAFKEGDTIKVLEVSGYWWRGHLADGPEEKKYFPGHCVCVQDRPVARFDLNVSALEGADLPVTVVLMLLQPEVTQLRKFYTRKEDGLNYKDKRFPKMKMVIAKEGKAEVKKTVYSRCAWTEIKVQGGGTRSVYAFSMDGLGSAFTMRAFVKDGTAELIEVPGADLLQLKDVLRKK